MATKIKIMVCISLVVLNNKIVLITIDTCPKVFRRLRKSYERVCTKPYNMLGNGLEDSRLHMRSSDS